MADKAEQSRPQVIPLRRRILQPALPSFEELVHRRHRRRRVPVELPQGCGCFGSSAPVRRRRALRGSR